MSGQEFKDHSFQILFCRYKESEGWQIECHPRYKHHPATYRRVPDFVITMTRYSKEAVLAETKYVAELTVGHLEQLLDYSEVFKKIRPGFIIREKIMLIGPRDHTYISSDIYEYADNHNIEITRLPVYL